MKINVRYRETDHRGHVTDGEWKPMPVDEFRDLLLRCDYRHILVEVIEHPAKHDHNTSFMVNDYLTITAGIGWASTLARFLSGAATEGTAA